MTAQALGGPAQQVVVPAGGMLSAVQPAEPEGVA
jgi:hypothetical protein